MFRRTAVTFALVASIALGLAASAGAAVPGGQQNWLNMDASLHPRTTWLSNQAFRLKSNFNAQLLGYGHQTWGVDLQWGDHGDWIIGLSGHGGTRAVTQADRVSLYNTSSKKYLVYGHQNYGVDLVWSDTPHFEWQLAGTGRNRGLYNDSARDYLQFGERTFGINLVWNFREIGDEDFGVEPPDYEPAPSGSQVSYVTLGQALTPSPLHERYSGRLTFQTYHQATVDSIQNTSHYPISIVANAYPYPNHCSGLVLPVGASLSGQQLATATHDQLGPRATYDIRSCGAVGGTGDGSAPLVRVTYHYVG